MVSRLPVQPTLHHHHHHHPATHDDEQTTHGRDEDPVLHTADDVVLLPPFTGIRRVICKRWIGFGRRRRRRVGLRRGVRRRCASRAGARVRTRTGRKPLLVNHLLLRARIV